MVKRILFILLAALIVMGIVYVGVRFFARSQTPSSSGTQSTSVTGSQDNAPLFGSGGSSGGNTPLFGSSSSSDTSGSSGIRTITSTNATPAPDPADPSKSCPANDHLCACPAHWASGEPDADHDGLPDRVEKIYGTDPNRVDTDNDGHNDSDEVKNGYDPLTPGSARLDSDHDNLLDNEECQWNTDPFNPDTDGDGFKDGEEVKNGYDPTKAGDGKGSDALPAKQAASADSIVNQLRPNPNSSNYTEGLAGIVLGNKPADQAKQTQVTPDQVAQILNNVKLNTTLPDVKISEIRVQQSNTAADIQRYLSAVSNLAPPEISDTGIISNALLSAFNGNSTGLANLRARLKDYETALLGVSVPPSAAQYHEELISIARFVNDRLGTIQQYAVSDPVRAYVAAREMQVALPPATTKLQSLKNTLTQLAGTSTTSSTDTSGGGF